MQLRAAPDDLATRGYKLLSRHRVCKTLWSPDNRKARRKSLDYARHVGRRAPSKLGAGFLFRAAAASSCARQGTLWDGKGGNAEKLEPQAR